MRYEEMNLKQKATHLLKIDVTAKIDIDPEKIEPGFVAEVKGKGTLPCGFHDTEQSAIDAGINWLTTKIQ